MAELSVGRELLDVPLPAMVLKLGLGIAEAQAALDDNSVATAKALADTEVSVVPGITQTIDADGKVSYVAADPIDMSLLVVGLNPTFYQFSEASISVSMDIKTTTSTQTDVKVSATVKGGFGLWSASVTAEASHSRKFQKEVHGTSQLDVRLVPVPPPPRIFPVMTTVDNRPS